MKPKGPTARTKSKIARAIALIGEAAEDDANDWEAAGALSRALAALRRAQSWEQLADNQRRDEAERKETKQSNVIVLASPIKEQSEQAG